MRVKSDSRTAGAVEATAAVESPPAVPSTVQTSLASLLIMPEPTRPAPAAAQPSPTVDLTDGIAGCPARG